MSFALKSVLVLCTGWGLLTLAACGSTSGASNSGTSQKLASAKVTRGPDGIFKSDGDRDADEHSKALSNDDEVELVLPARENLGASAADKRKIEAVVKRYFAAAAAGDSATACSLLVPSLAAAVSAQAGTRAASQSRCAASLSRLFARQHPHLATEQVQSMVVTGVHVGGNLGFVTLGFKHALESEVLVQHAGREWKLDSLLDSSLP